MESPSHQSTKSWPTSEDELGNRSEVASSYDSEADPFDIDPVAGEQYTSVQGTACFPEREAQQHFPLLDNPADNEVRYFGLNITFMSRISNLQNTWSTEGNIFMNSTHFHAFIALRPPQWFKDDYQDLLEPVWVPTKNNRSKKEFNRKIRVLCVQYSRELQAAEQGTTWQIKGSFYPNFVRWSYRRAEEAVLQARNEPLELMYESSVAQLVFIEDDHLQFAGADVEQSLHWPLGTPIISCIGIVSPDKYTFHHQKGNSNFLTGRQRKMMGWITVYSFLPMKTTTDAPNGSQIPKQGLYPCDIFIFLPDKHPLYTKRYQYIANDPSYWTAKKKLLLEGYFMGFLNTDLLEDQPSPHIQIPIIVPTRLNYFGAVSASGLSPSTPRKFINPQTATGSQTPSKSAKLPAYQSSTPKRPKGAMTALAKRLSKTSAPTQTSVPATDTNRSEVKDNAGAGSKTQPVKQQTPEAPYPEILSDKARDKQPETIPPVTEEDAGGLLYDPIEIEEDSDTIEPDNGAESGADNSPITRKRGKGDPGKKGQRKKAKK